MRAGYGAMGRRSGPARSRETPSVSRTGHPEGLGTPVPAPALPPPAALGAPALFRMWRPHQADAVLAALDSPARFVALAMPTGSGKSLVYVVASLLGGGRAAILTSTKGLEDQLMRDFAPSGLVDVRGQANYPCLELERALPGSPPHTCEEGPCHARFKCELKDGGCLYYDAYRTACQSRLLVTNYAYWMTQNAYGEGLGDFDLLVLDEAHAAPDELADFLAVEIEAWEVEGLLGEDLPSREPGGGWIGWARRVGEAARDRLEELHGEIRHHMKEGGGANLAPKRVHHARMLRMLVKKLAQVQRAGAVWVADWVRSKSGHRRLRFDPVWPANFGETCLFLKIPKVLLVSATVRPKTVDLLGVKGKELEFREYPSCFPLAHRTVAWVPTVRMNRHTTPDQLRLWLARIDQIIGRRLDRKGVVHTVSYQRAEYVLRNSEHRGIMLAHDPATTRAMVQKFRNMKSPAVLVSPSVTTGWDFPYGDCRYQIIGKIPFPDNRVKAVAERSKRDPDYLSYLAMQGLVQAAGRGVRAADDWCETFIIDDSIGWFLEKNRRFAPRWFLEAFRREAAVPVAYSPTR